jgi:hypothetical protein
MLNSFCPGNLLMNSTSYSKIPIIFLKCKTVNLHEAFLSSEPENNPENCLNKIEKKKRKKCEHPLTYTNIPGKFVLNDLITE